MTYLTLRIQQENLTFPLSQYLASRQHQFMCCAIPKNGCTMLKRWFLAAVDPQPPEVDVHVCTRDNHALCNWPSDEVAVALRDYFTFVFVRDPIKRIASAFIDKLVTPVFHELFEGAREVMEENERLHGAEVPLDIRSEIRYTTRSFEVPASSAVAYRRGLTFREFVQYLCASPDDHLDEHWRPQSAFLAGNRFDLVARVDHMSAILPVIGERLGLPDIPVFAENVSPTSPEAPGGQFVGDILSRELHRRRICPSADMLYDAELRELVLSRYRADAELYEHADTAAAFRNRGSFSSQP